MPGPIITVHENLWTCYGTLYEESNQPVCSSGVETNHAIFEENSQVDWEIGVQNILDFSMTSAMGHNYRKYMLAASVKDYHYKISSYAVLRSTRLEREDIRQLEDTAWLSEPIINAFMNGTTAKFRHCCGFNAFLMVMLMVEERRTNGIPADQPPSVKNHIKNLGKCWERHDMLFIPVIHEFHWTLIVLDLKVGRILYYDPEQRYADWDMHINKATAFFRVDLAKRN